MSAAPMHCHYCRRLMCEPKTPEFRQDQTRVRSRDHKIPKRFVAERERHAIPILMCCAGCNMLRSDAPYEVFKAYMDRCHGEGRRANQKGFAIFRYLLLMAGLKAVMRDAREIAEART